jgi:hypothetical protein
LDNAKSPVSGGLVLVYGPVAMQKVVGSSPIIRS